MKKCIFCGKKLGSKQFDFCKACLEEVQEEEREDNNFTQSPEDKRDAPKIR